MPKSLILTLIFLSAQPTIAAAPPASPQQSEVPPVSSPLESVIGVRDWLHANPQFLSTLKSNLACQAQINRVAKAKLGRDILTSAMSVQQDDAGKPILGTYLYSVPHNRAFYVSQEFTPGEIYEFNPGPTQAGGPPGKNIKFKIDSKLGLPVLLSDSAPKADLRLLSVAVKPDDKRPLEWLQANTFLMLGLHSISVVIDSNKMANPNSAYFKGIIKIIMGELKTKFGFEPTACREVITKGVTFFTSYLRSTPQAAGKQPAAKSKGHQAR